MGALGKLEILPMVNILGGHPVGVTPDLLRPLSNCGAANLASNPLHASPAFAPGFCVRAPTVYSSDDDEQPRRLSSGFSISLDHLAPSGDIEFEDSSPTGARPRLLSHNRAGGERVALKLVQSCELRARERSALLAMAQNVRAVRGAEARERALIVQEAQRAQRAIEKADDELAAARREMRDARRKVLDHEHRAKAVAADSRIARDIAEEDARRRREAEEEARRRAEAARVEREARLAAEERVRKEAEEALARENQAKQAAAAQAQQEAQARAQAAASQSSGPDGKPAVGLGAISGAAASSAQGKVVKAGPRVHVSPSAEEEEKRLAAVLAQLDASLGDFPSSDAYKPERRKIERRIVLQIQQISATVSQVRAKVSDIVAMFREVPPTQQPQHNYALRTFASKLLAQCESQVQKLPTFAFPLAYVTTAVCAQVPGLADIILALFHRACPLTVPKYTPYLERAYPSKEAYCELIGMKKKKVDGVDSDVLESTDDYVGRMQGYVCLYAAILQVDAAGGAMGGAGPRGGFMQPQPLAGGAPVPGFCLAHAWAWLARLLNHLPPNRQVGAALHEFLKVAGYRVGKAYGQQAGKLMRVVGGEFLPALKGVAATKDADARAVCTRLEAYLSERAYLQEPEGRTLPEMDLSSECRA
eukprot:jgi/Mesvir1/17957/Mv13003-RA.1